MTTTIWRGTSTSAGEPAGGGTFGLSDTALYGTAALAVKTWSHVAVTYDGEMLQLYLNGTQVSSTLQTGAIATSVNPLQIGGDSLYGQFFKGMIDEVRIYNRALSPAEIQSDMNTPIIAIIDTQPPSAPTNLVATVMGATEIELNWTASTDNWQ